MNGRWRLILLACAVIVLLPGVWQTVAAMPPFGRTITAYGSTIDAMGPSLRKVSNMVALVNFDMRGIDTLGEESMLLCAVTGVVVLLRGSRGEAVGDRAARLPERPVERRSDATVIVCRLSATALLLYGIYIGLHGMVTPGGGFQGGVIAASSLLLLYLGEGYAFWRSFLRSGALALLEGAGALLFVLMAVVPLFFGRTALENILPFGTFRDMFSGGSMVVINFAVGCAVAGSFGLLLYEFMEETRRPSHDRTDQRGRSV